MKIWKFDNANSLYYALLDTLQKEVESIIQSGRDPVIALPTGNTMIPFFRLAAENEERLQVHRWRCFNLDEYYPVNSKNVQLSFETYMDLHFFSRLKNGVAARSMLNGRTKDPENECQDFEKKIQDAGGIDLCLLGLGTNGHIGFNEPGSELNTRTRMVELHPDTLMANFHGKTHFTHALTLGIESILEAKSIYILALGKTKANAVKYAVVDTPSRKCPASILQRHPNVTWFLDQEAANFI